MRKNLILTCLIILIILIVYFSLFTVKIDEYAIITQFGKPVKIIKTPGLYFKFPGFINKINRFDKKINLFKTQPIQLLLGDKNPLILTCYVCWQISEPLVYFQSVGLEPVAMQKLNDMVNSQLGSTLGDYSIENILNTDTSKIKFFDIENTIKNEINKKAYSKYGISIVSLGIRRINYPEVVAASVYNRMRTEREKEAKKYRAEGKEEASKIEAETDKEVSSLLSEAYKQSEIIKGQGDKEAIKIYSDAYSKDPNFFEFLKSLDIYKDILKKETTLILSTESELFKYLNYNEKNDK